MKTIINEKFWTSDIYPKIKNLNQTDQTEVITELRDSEISDNIEILTFLDDMVTDYITVPVSTHKLCVGTDIKN